MRYLILALLLQGCAVQTPVLDTENARGGFVVTKPPMQVSFRGDVTPEVKEFTLDVINSLSKVPYHSYRFNENHNVRLNSIDGKSDKVQIILHESANTGDTNASAN